MAIPDGLRRVSLGSNKPRPSGPKPPKSKTKEVHSRVVTTFNHISGMKTISPTSRSTNVDGYPRFVFTGYTFDEVSGTSHAGSTNILSDIELSVNTVTYHPSQYTVTVNPTNIIIDFTEDIFVSEGVEVTDVVRLRARVRQV